MYKECPGIGWVLVKLTVFTAVNTGVAQISCCFFLSLSLSFFQWPMLFTVKWSCCSMRYLSSIFLEGLKSAIKIGHPTSGPVFQLRICGV